MGSYGNNTPARGRISSKHFRACNTERLSLDVWLRIVYMESNPVLRPGKLPGSLCCTPSPSVDEEIGGGEEYICICISFCMEYFRE